MIKYIPLLLGVFCCFSSNSQAIEINELLPEEFKVTQHWFSWTNTFSIGTKDYNLGTVSRSLLSWSYVQYDFYDNVEVLQASGKMRWLSWGAVFDVEDANKAPLGRIEEKFSWFFPSFSFISPENVIQAEAHLNFWGTTYTVIDPLSGQTIALMHRDFFRIKDDWTVKIVNQELFLKKEIDPRLFVIVMAFQTDKDKWGNDNNFKYDITSSSFEEVQTTDLAKKIENKLKSPESNLLSLVEFNKEKLKDITLADEDFEWVDSLFTKKSLELEENFEILNLEEESTVILSLFQEENLSPAQQKAFWLILESRLNGTR